MKSHPEIGVYIGSGASHSWTWFADIFDRTAYDSVCFLDEQELAGGGLDRLDLLFISGGDTFAIANGLGKAGADAIERFVGRGGTYIGSCAGAYLPLYSSLPPLNRFNFVQAKIANLTKDLPQALAKPEKYCTEYGCRYVYHPAREAVRIRLTGSGGGEFEAPLYGGPALLPSDDVEVLAEYAGFTDRTEYLIAPDLAERSLIGTAAAVRKRYGRGMFYLFGPHFEHPAFTEANELLFRLMNENGSRSVATIPPAASAPVGKAAYRDFLSAISNARIIALGLERAAYQWLIGRKVYDPEKIRVFLEAVWQRARALNAPQVLCHVENDDLKPLEHHALKAVDLLRRIRKEKLDASGGAMLAAELFYSLRMLASGFLSIYFRLKKGGVVHQ